MPTPFAAYTGDNGYVFVCYSHADTDTVYADIAMLHDAGLNIWYDEGISPGSEWSEELGKALQGASQLLFYTSNQSVQSRHCRDEINFAHNHDIPILSIHLEDVALPVGLELSLSSTQAIKREQLDDAVYVQKIKGALPATVFSEPTSQLSMQPSTQHTSQPTSQTSPQSSMVTPASTKKRGLLIPALLVALVVVVATVYLNRNSIAAQLVLSAPFLFFDPIEQQIGFATTSDDVRIAYAVTGEGPPILMVLGWSTHLEDGVNSPTYDAEGVIAMTSEAFHLIRFDGRGFGLSDRNVEDMSVDARVRDIEAVVQTLGLDQFYLYALSSGGQPGVVYAARHPDKVKGLVLASTFGSYVHLDEAVKTEWAEFLDKVAAEWESDSVVDDLVNRVFSGEPNLGENKIIRGFLRRSADGQTVHDFFTGTSARDVSEEASHIAVPTMVMHGRDDAVVRLIAGRELAAQIPGARFVIVEGGHQEGVGGTVPNRQRILDFFLSLQQENPIPEIRTTQP